MFIFYTSFLILLSFSLFSTIRSIFTHRAKSLAILLLSYRDNVDEDDDDDDDENVVLLLSYVDIDRVLEMLRKCVNE